MRERLLSGALSLLIEVPVPNHKYKVGQNVRFRPPRMGSLVGAQDCKVLRQLPIEGGVFLYRIKCMSEKVERVAKESELQPPLL
jgi:hypothetical protein